MVNCEIIRLIKTETTAHDSKLIQFYKLGRELELIATTRISIPPTKKPVTSQSTTIRAVRITIKTAGKNQIHYREILKDGKTRGLMSEIQELPPAKPQPPKSKPEPAPAAKTQQQQPVVKTQPQTPVGKKPISSKSAPLHYSDEPRVIDQTEETIPITRY